MQSDTLGRISDALAFIEQQPVLTDGQLLLRDSLVAWQRVAGDLDAWGLMSLQASYDSDKVDSALDAAVVAREESDLFRASGLLAEELASFLKRTTVLAPLEKPSVSDTWQEIATDYLRTAGSLRSSAVRLQAAELNGQAAMLAATAAEASADSAKRAAGTAGEASLASYFQTYARHEHAASWLFRFLAFAGLASTAVLAWWLFVESENVDLKVSSLILRSAMVLAIAAFSTYSIRLAGQHRHQGNWAKSIAVQLNSFGAFMEPVESGEVKDAIYEQFARRVLGAPPESRTTAPEGTLQITAHDLISLIPKS
ncbi:hypothetical protein IFT79_07110 [Frigoribacterium sp. CFBP 8759]|uniref:hypothetical protein n=1 Tax=Frigoribacterium sp. CFBP 8759 TaxID=2775283 RepID=UPI00177B5CBD|nr:hypothetical protein [Frigoribacterium sp. CFBP 8759]MBD8485381.1 hypothetical protein [Frigoribacterium sp. CFBP 8759]